MPNMIPVPAGILALVDPCRVTLALQVLMHTKPSFKSCSLIFLSEEMRLREKQVRTQEAVTATLLPFVYIDYCMNYALSIYSCLMRMHH